MENQRLAAHQDKDTSGLPVWLQTKVKQLADELSRYCGPIFIVPSLNSDPTEIRSGTFALIDTGQKRLLVTCFHVWYDYEERHSANDKTRLAVAVSDSVISFTNPKEHLIAADKDLDLAVFEFEPRTINVSHKKSWFKIRDWPIPKVNKGIYIVTLGYPGAGRTSSGNVCKVQSVPFPLEITDTNDRTISVFNTEKNQNVFNDLKDCLGGISGSPAYCFSKKGELQLIGFVKDGPLESSAPNRQYQAESGSPLSAALFFTHASFLQRDGTLGCVDIPVMSQPQDSCSTTKTT
jgi:hypothetical protein